MSIPCQLDRFFNFLETEMSKPLLPKKKKFCKEFCLDKNREIDGL